MGLAGCVGSSASHGVETSATTPTAIAGQGGGTLNVVVTDDSLQVLSGVSVAVAETRTTTITDASGRAQIVGLEPGTYTVQAQRLGYESVARKVTVGDVPVDVKLVLAPLAVVEAYHNILYFKGLMTCGVGLVVVAGTLCGSIPTPAGNVTIDPNNKVFFDQPGVPDLKMVVAEMSWRPAAALAASALQIYLWQNHRCAPVCDPEYDYGHAEGKSPVTLRSEGPFAGLKKGPATITHTVWTPYESGGPPYAVVVAEQAFELYSTHFFGEVAPDDFTALPDR